MFYVYYRTRGGSARPRPGPKDSMPLPETVLQTSSCTDLFCNFVLQTVLGVGMGMNVAAHGAPLLSGGGPLHA